MKAHKLSQLVNDLRDISARFYNHESLRDRISQTLSDYGINEGWPTLDEYHLLALTFAYEKGFSAGLEGSNTENVFGQSGGQSAAFDVGLQEGRAASQRRKPYAPDGWKLVPIEPTEEMVRIATAEYVQASSRRLHPNIAWRRAFQAMLAAAPEGKP